MIDHVVCMDFEINSRKRQIVINYANIKSLSVNFYTTNTQVLFSQGPFLDLNNPNENDSGGENEMFSYVSSNAQINC